jgi:hypothetical protein
MFVSVAIGPRIISTFAHILILFLKRNGLRRNFTLEIFTQIGVIDSVWLAITTNYYYKIIIFRLIIRSLIFDRCAFIIAKNNHKNMM